MNFESLGRMLITFGLVILIVGALFFALGHLGFKGLPGDIFIKRDGFSLHFPWVTSIVVSLVLTILINLILHLFRR
ncbi:MAG: DUF2905 domain-containing protein [Actinomycetota bacterium]|nr:DUF2905 domain-containing protein [Actinomycetota bacterium]